MALIYDSSHSGQEIDAAVDAVQTTIPSQLTQIGSKIGDLANLTTTEKSNLVAAINEIKNAIENLSGDAADISYTDTLGLGADNVQDAIDALQNNAQSIFGMTEEEGFYIVDSNGYIGFGIRPNGEVLGGASYRIIEEDTI